MEAVKSECKDSKSYEITTGKNYTCRLQPPPGSMSETQSGSKAPYRALQSHQVDVAERNERLAARRGLLMGILCILTCSEEQEIPEEELFKLLRLDSRLEGVSGEGGAGAKRGRSAAYDTINEDSMAVFEDQGGFLIGRKVKLVIVGPGVATFPF